MQRSAMNRLEVRRLSANTDWSDIIKNQNVVIHTAARAHIMQEEASDPLKEYRRVNVEGTLVSATSRRCWCYALHICEFH